MRSLQLTSSSGIMPLSDRARLRLPVSFCSSRECTVPLSACACECAWCATLVGREREACEAAAAGVACVRVCAVVTSVSGWKYFERIIARGGIVGRGDAGRRPTRDGGRLRRRRGEGEQRVDRKRVARNAHQVRIAAYMHGNASLNTICDGVTVVPRCRWSIVRLCSLSLSFVLARS
jgi:hypothetical protein